MVANPQLSLKVKIFPGYTPATYTPALSGYDITSYVRLEEGVTFNRGAGDETSFPSAGRCSFVLNNRDYRFTPDNTDTVDANLKSTAGGVTSLLFKNRMPVRVERAAGATVNASAISINKAYATYVVPSGHGIVTGQYVTVANATNAVNNGTWLVTSTTATSVHVFMNKIGTGEATTSATLTPAAAVWTGFVETIEEHWNGGIQPVVVVSASDYLAVYARQKLPLLASQAQILDGAKVVYPLNDDPTSKISADASGNGYDSLSRATVGVTTTATLQTMTFAASGFGSDPDTNALSLFRHSSTIGYYMTSSVSIASSATGTAEGYFYLSNGAMAADLLRIESPTTAYGLRATSAATMISIDRTAATPSATTRITAGATVPVLDDYGWHHLALTWSYTSSTTTWTMYVDGVSAGTWAETSTAGPAVNVISVGGGRDAGVPATTWAANIAVYSSALSAAKIADHAAAVTGYPETTAARFTRIMAAAQVSTSLYSASATTPAVSMGPQPTRDVTLLDVLQQINDAEDGAIYVDGRGATQYFTRTDRDDATATISLDPKYLSPSTTIMRAPVSVNTVTASRATGGSVTVSDATSVAENGTASESISLYVANDYDLNAVAKRRLYRRTTQQPRIGNVVVDLTTSSAVNDALLGADIGTYLSIGPLPRGAVDTLLVRIEGITDSISPTSWTRTFITSPAFKSKSGTTWTLGTSLLGYTTTLA